MIAGKDAFRPGEAKNSGLQEQHHGIFMQSPNIFWEFKPDYDGLEISSLYPKIMERI